MKEFPNYREINGLINSQEFIEYYKKAGMEKFVDIIKKSGKTINPYNGKWKYENLLNNLDDYFVQEEVCNIVLWKTMLEETRIINQLYKDIFSMQIYKKAEEVPKEKTVASFVIILEKYLRFIINEINGQSDKNEELGFNFNTEFAFDNNMTQIQKYINMYDHIIHIADNILKYLLFYKCNGIKQDIDTTDEYQEASFGHLSVADQKSIIEKIEKEWRMFDRKIKTEGSTTESSCESKEFLDFHIVQERLISRKNKIIHDIQIAQDASGIIDKEKGISNDEKSANLFLKNILAVDNLHYSCNVHKRKGNDIYTTYIDYLVRAYTVLKLMVKKYEGEKQKYSNIISETCLIVGEDEVKNQFIEAGIPLGEVDVLFKILEYENYKDVYDTPIIPFNDTYLLIPSMIDCIDIAQVVLSCVNEFNFKGEAFERLVISSLKEAGIKCTSKKYKDDTGEYQCDLLFVINKSLFICECKSWGESRSIISYYERNGKCFDAYRQLNRIATKYVERIDDIKQDLGISNNIVNVHKIILLSNAVGIENLIDDVFFMDYSSFQIFVERKKPSVNLYHNKVIYQYNMQGFNEFEGKITENKFMKYIRKVSAVKLMELNTEKKIRSIDIENDKINYDTYICKEDEYLMPDRDIDDYMRSIEKIYSLH